MQEHNHRPALTHPLQSKRQLRVLQALHFPQLAVRGAVVGTEDVAVAEDKVEEDSVREHAC